MRTAVLISGQMRSFASCVRNAHWHLFRRLTNPVFVISCADDAQADHAEFIREFASDVFIERVAQPTLPEPDFDLTRHAPYAPAASSRPSTVVQGILRQLWHRQRVWHMADELGLAGADVVVRYRPDLLFQGLDVPADVVDGSLPSHRLYAPWKATCGGVNDRLGFMGPAAALAYFNAFAGLTTLLDNGCPLHPESILLAVLEECGVDIRNTLLAEFTTIRLPGEGDHVGLVEYPGELARFIHATINSR